MLVLKIITCIFIFIGCFLIEGEYRTRTRNIGIGVTLLLYIGFCALLIVTNWNIFTFPKICLVTTICLYILFGDSSFYVGILFTIIAYLIAIVMYFNNIQECKTPDVETSSFPILCAKDTSSISGDMYGLVTYIQGNVSEKSEYRYYYELEDGGIKLESIPAELTTLYYIEDGERARIETIITTTYSINNNKTPATRCMEKSETSYKLYVPKGSITNTYEFDTN